MKKRLFLPVLSVLLTLGAFTPGHRSAADKSAAAPVLSFDENGYFTVMVLSDAQDTHLTVPYLISGIEAALENEPPDLVILLGDQIEGESPLMRIGSAEKNVSAVIDRVLAPIVSRNIPFAVVFGNHDSESGVSNEAQLAMYQKYPGCVAVGVDASGAYRVPVLGRDGKAALQLYLFDSGAYAADGGYACVDLPQVEWYRAESSALQAENAGAVTPAVAFQHIIVGEIYDALTETTQDAPGAIAGVGSGRDKFYRPDSACILSGTLREAPCPSAENYGQFDAFLQQGDVFAAFFGHDHINDFIASYRGIDLVACPGATYTSYNDRAARGVRMLRFSEDNVRDYETRLLPFAALENVSLLGMFPYYLFVTTGISNIIKTGGAAVLLALIAATTVLLLKKRRKKPRVETAPPPSEFDD